MAIAIPILYEDSDVLVINKPAGVIVEDLPAQAGLPPYLAHRLDKDTSGVLVIAKSEPVKEFLQQQFRERKIKKTYSALVYGVVKADEGVIAYPIGRSRNDPRKRVARVHAVGKKREALTRFKVAQRFKDYTLLEVFPETGRTHQIRVHLKSIHHPVVCDKLYAENKPCLPGLERQALHAAKLEFMLPNNKLMSIEATMPDDLAQSLNKLPPA